MNAPLLVCRDLDVRVGERSLVRSLQLQVAPGERWAVVGPNGAGKTTLLHVLAGVRPAQGGTVELAGQILGRWSVEHLAGLRALVTDRWIDPFATSVLETVMAARFRMRGALRGRAGADRHARALAMECLVAMDCKELAGRDVRYLSRGERQRVALAAALAQETPLVLLDEPISHQDPRHQSQVLWQLQLRRERTYVGVLHDINAAARFATHALLLCGDGRWQAGPSSEVLCGASLSPLFGTEILEARVGAHRVFVSNGGAPI